MSADASTLPAALDAPGVALTSDALIVLRRFALNASATPHLVALPGGFATRFRGHGLEVSDTREYMQGDDIRHLDRGTTARTGRLHVRRFQQERDRVSLLIADFRPAMFWGLRRAFRSVAVAEALSLTGWNVVESGGRVGLLALTAAGPVIVPPRGRVRGMLDVIGGMVRAHCSALTAMVSGPGPETGGDPPLDAGLARVDRMVPSGSELVIASGFDAPGDGLADRLNGLARRRRPWLLMIVDGASGKMPRGRYPIRLRDGRRVRVDLGGPGSTPDGIEQIAGRPALVLDASETVEQTARRLAAGFQWEPGR